MLWKKQLIFYIMYNKRITITTLDNNAINHTNQSEHVQFYLLNKSHSSQLTIMLKSKNSHTTHFTFLTLGISCFYLKFYKLLDIHIWHKSRQCKLAPVSSLFLPWPLLFDNLWLQQMYFAAIYVEFCFSSLVKNISIANITTAVQTTQNPGNR